MVLTVGAAAGEIFHPGIAVRAPRDQRSRVTRSGDAAARRKRSSQGPAISSGPGRSDTTVRRPRPSAILIHSRRLRRSRRAPGRWQARRLGSAGCERACGRAAAAQWSNSRPSQRRGNDAFPRLDRARPEDDEHRSRGLQPQRQRVQPPALVEGGDAVDAAGVRLPEFGPFARDTERHTVSTACGWPLATKYTSGRRPAGGGNSGAAAGREVGRHARPASTCSGVLSAITFPLPHNSSASASLRASQRG